MDLIDGSKALDDTGGRLKDGGAGVGSFSGYLRHSFELIDELMGGDRFLVVYSAGELLHVVTRKGDECGFCFRSWRMQRALENKQTK